MQSSVDGIGSGGDAKVFAADLGMFLEEAKESHLQAPSREFLDAVFTRVTAKSQVTPAARPL